MFRGGEHAILICVLKRHHQGFQRSNNNLATWLGNESTKGTDYAAALKAIDFMNNSPPEPFVIFLPGIGSHPPYGAPKDYYDM